MKYVPSDGMCIGISIETRYSMYFVGEDIQQASYIQSSISAQGIIRKEKHSWPKGHLHLTTMVYNPAFLQEKLLYGASESVSSHRQSCWDSPTATTPSEAAWVIMHFANLFWIMLYIIIPEYSTMLGHTVQTMHSTEVTGKLYLFPHSCIYCCLNPRLGREARIQNTVKTFSPVPVL